MLPCLTVFVAVLFTSLAALGLWTLLITLGEGEDPAFLTRLLIKGVCFALITVASGLALKRLARTRPKMEEAELHDEKPFTSKECILFSATLCLILTLILPRLYSYPRAEPDELHHLVVAKNLAERGYYASGHEESGYIFFDSYDSVGAPVIAPIAAAFKLFGTRIAVARTVIMLYYLALCVAVYFLLRPVFGTGASLLGLILMTTSYGSIYFARSLYGEVPALFFLTACLIFWRKAIEAKSARIRIVTGVVAGALFGLAVLSKTIIIISACVFIGLYIFDKIIGGKLRLSHILVPACSSVAIIGIWWGIQNHFHHEVAEAGQGTLSEYRHYLMFGLGSVSQGLEWMLQRPVTLSVSIVALGLAAPIIFIRRYDPPSIFLFVYALFMAYWFLFFTPGRIPRYMWTSFAIAAQCAGFLGWKAARSCLGKGEAAEKSWKSLGAGAIVIAMIVVPAAVRAGEQADHIFLRDDSKKDRDLAALVDSLPADASIATMFWPVVRRINFSNGRHATIINEADNLEGSFDLIIDWIPQSLPQGPKKIRVPGRYTVVLSDRLKNLKLN